MSKTLAVLEVGGNSRTGSHSILPYRRFGDVTLVEWLVRRISDAQHVDQIVVLTAEGDVEAARRSLPRDVSVFHSNRPDWLARFAETVRCFEAHGAVRVSLTSPLVDPGLVDRLATTADQHPGVDYVGFCSNGTMPAMLSQVGLFCDWVRGEALMQADRIATQTVDREDPVRFILAHPELFQLRLIPVPEPLDRPDLRLTADLEEDWDHLHTIYEALGPEGLDWQRVAGLLDQQPGLRQRMAALNSLSQAGWKA